MPYARIPSILLPILCLLGLALVREAQAEDISTISAEEFYGAAYFKQALEHPAVAKQRNRQKQITVVARDLKWKPARLKRAIAKVEALGDDPIALAKGALEHEFAAARVRGRVLDVLLNDDEPKHVVLYIRWQAQNARDVVKDAAAIAAVTARAAPLVSTLSLAAIHPRAERSSKAPVWSGKIGTVAAKRIQEDRIEDYADGMYTRLFEGIEKKPF